jgi:hypothetical protein
LNFPIYVIFPLPPPFRCAYNGIVSSETFVSPPTRKRPIAGYVNRGEVNGLHAAALACPSNKQGLREARFLFLWVEELRMD